MAGFLDSLLTLTASEDVVLQVTVSLIILVVGHLSVKLLNKTFKNFYIKPNLQKKEVQNRLETLEYVGYILEAGVILAALLYLNAGVTSEITTEFVSFLPQLLSVALIGILGFIAINIFTKFGLEFLKKVGVQNYFREIGLTGNTVNVIAGIVKGFLYLLLLQIALKQLGIGDTFINELVTASSWAAALLIASLIFWGFKDLFQNAAAGIYLKNSRMVRPGEEIRIGEETGEIREISVFSTTVNTEKGYTVLRSNRSIMDSELRFKRTKNDIETLEDIKKYFVAEEEGNCGPASAEMALDIFGYRHAQETLVTKIEDKDLKTNAALMESIEELTEENVRTAFIGRSKISDLGNEFKAWLNDGALAILVLDKSKIYSDADGEYMLAVAYESGEVLAVDPATTTNGVYFLEESTIEDAMVTEEHGYIAIAPKGTNAYWRIKNDLIYSDKKLYDELSKTLEARLTKIIRQGRILNEVMPDTVKNYLDDWRADRYVSRLIEYEGEENEDTNSE